MNPENPESRPDMPGGASNILAARFFRLAPTRAGIVVISIFTGCVSAIAAAALINSVTFFHEISQGLSRSSAGEWLRFFFPLMGVTLSALFVKWFLRGEITKGLSHLLNQILRKNSRVPLQNTYSHIVTSGMTIGFGGSAGLEAPIVFTGAALGSNIATALRLSYTQRTLLLACGAAAGISAVFNTPVAGVIFALEVLLPEFSLPAFIPLLIASASASVLSKALGLHHTPFVRPGEWQMEAIPFYVVLGIVAGLVSVYLMRVVLWIEKKLGAVSAGRKALGGGLALCVLVFVFPQLYGEGYGVLNALLKGNMEVIVSGRPLFNLPAELTFIIMLLLIILTKAFATGLTVASGGNGGIIAPSLFSGGITGMLVGKFAALSGLIVPNLTNFTVVGMAGVLAGVLHAPLTGIFLIAEITGGYSLMPPLMIVSALSYFVSRYFQKHSIYNLVLAEQGVFLHVEREKQALNRIALGDVIDREYQPLNPETTLREVIDRFTHSTKNLLPVVDPAGKFKGVVYLNDIKEVMLQDEMYDVVLAYEIMRSDVPAPGIDTPTEKVMDMFEDTGLLNLPVTENGIFAGFISKASLMTAYLHHRAEKRDDVV